MKTATYEGDYEVKSKECGCGPVPEQILGGSQRPLSPGGTDGTLAGTLQSTLLHNQQMHFNFNPFLTGESRL